MAHVSKKWLIGITVPGTPNPGYAHPIPATDRRAFSPMAQFFQYLFSNRTEPLFVGGITHHNSI
jgi:hypothetical protein